MWCLMYHKKFTTFVAICLKYFSVFCIFNVFTVFCIYACAEYRKIPNVWNIPILYQFMVAKYFHKFYIFQKSYFKESWRFTISYCFQ